MLLILATYGSPSHRQATHEHVAKVIDITAALLHHVLMFVCPQSLSVCTTHMLGKRGSPCKYELVLFVNK